MSATLQKAASAQTVQQKEERAAYIAALGFPILVIIGGLVGFAAPSVVLPLKGWVNLLLGVVMFGMGLTLKPADFVLVAKRPLPVLIGVVSQYVVMPLLAVVLVWVMQLPAEVAAGVILVGCAPGGTSSNVVSYLARGDVALSVTMTSISTLLAPVLTPLLTLWLAGQYMPVSGAAMAVSIVKVVLLPVVGGLALRAFFNSAVQKVEPALPWVSVVAISVIAATVVAGSKETIATLAVVVFVAVVLHNCFGYVLGFFASKFTGGTRTTSRTTAIEVGMQNSGLAATLAMQYMSPTAALPAAVFSVWHNLSGAVVAALCRTADKRQASK
ncbi:MULTISPECIES: bile acid:sodium symporter family protein [unclassified Winkia]|uniref:bile acid:sodium symporter family protein n=1 Tax=unclassified Winkia TaxID=2692119 RepID=UPI002555F3AA|nr:MULTISPECIES: bile acid:sodium symporter family protein [unclassified Winkia]MDK7163207.1 bile acid:sodium symporter family protein [Winkia sp. UMB3105]MDK8594763.1 bile acid:sodium symporter family protein [Winkia sp. UMB1096A]